MSDQGNVARYVKAILDADAATASGIYGRERISGGDSPEMIAEALVALKKEIDALRQATPAQIPPG